MLANDFVASISAHYKATSAGAHIGFATMDVLSASDLVDTSLPGGTVRFVQNEERTRERASLAAAPKTPDAKVVWNETG